jgi:hypothetical protein
MENHGYLISAADEVFQEIKRNVLNMTSNPPA